MTKRPKVTVYNTEFIFKPNFGGREEKYNHEGDMYFNAIIPDELAVQMEEDGWNIKWLEPRDEDDIRKAYLKIHVSFRYEIPKFFYVNPRTKKKTEITPSRENLAEIDAKELESISFSITGSPFERDGATHYSAYLKSFYAVVEEDELAAYYADDEDELEEPYSDYED